MTTPCLRVAMFANSPVRVDANFAAAKPVALYDVRSDGAAGTVTTAICMDRSAAIYERLYRGADRVRRPDQGGSSCPTTCSSTSTASG